MGRAKVCFIALALITPTSACLVGRDLTLVTEETVSGAATPGPKEDELKSSEPDASPVEAGAPSANDAGKQPIGAKDAGTDAKPPPQGACVSEVEPNDQVLEGLKLTPGMTACGQLIVGSDVDWYLFDLGQGATTSIAFVTDGDAYVAIAGANGASYVGTNNFKTTFQGTGAFYVRIYSPNTKPQTYRITRE